MTYAPMLAEDIPKGLGNILDRFLDHPDHVVEQKMDGKRVIAIIKDGVVRFLNRSGDTYRQYMPPGVKAELSDPDVFREGQTWVFDGEVVNDSYFVFDLLETPEGPIADLPLRDRRWRLEAIFNAWETEHVHLVAQAKHPEDRRKLLEAIEEIGGEGIIIKDLNSPYSPGERSVAFLKHKLWDSADVIVTGRHPEGKRSVEIAVFDDGELVGVGSVSVADRWLHRLEVGDVIEVKYLYRGAQGHLYQPAFLRQRDDKNPYECTLDQLKPVCKDVVSATVEPTNPEGER